MFNKIKKFIFSSEDEYDEIEEKEVIPEIVIDEENVTRKEVFYSASQEEPLNSIFVEVETEQKEVRKEKDYRSYRQLEKKERAKETRGEESEYIPKQIISPIFGMSEQKNISKKDVELNDYETVIAKASSTKIISPMFGVNNQVTTKQEQVKSDSISNVNSVETQEKKAINEVVDQTQQFKLQDLQPIEENNNQNVKTMILATVNKQLEECAVEETTVSVPVVAIPKGDSQGSFGFAYRGTTHSEPTVLMGKKSEA